MFCCLIPTGSSQTLRKKCFGGFCISLPEEEKKADAGLCAVIPCMFYTPYSFTPQTMVWFKCESSKPKCGESDIILHPNDRKIPDGFKGRVLLFERDVTQRNCTIIINDLTEADSGSYQLRLNGWNYYGNPDGFTFPARATLSVEGMTAACAAHHNTH